MKNKCNKCKWYVYTHLHNNFRIGECHYCPPKYIGDEGRWPTVYEICGFCSKWELDNDEIPLLKPITNKICSVELDTSPKVLAAVKIKCTCKENSNDKD